MASSTSCANRINRRQTSLALLRLSSFPAEFQHLDLKSASNLTDAKRLQPIVHRLRNEHPAIPTEPQAIAGCTGRAISALRRFAKRILDLLLASIAILLLWPLMLMIAVAVRLESQGPAIYPSLRVGKRGMLFAGYKFRTMIHGADRLRHKVLHLHPRRGPFFKMADDPRVTRLGSFLRKYSLDELIPEVLSGSGE